MAKRPTKAFIPAELFEFGIGNIIVARFRGSGEVECAMFLADVHCLGIKNAMYRKIGNEEYEDFLRDAFGDAKYEEQPVECARKLVEEAVIYARSLGFAPHRDFKKAWRVMGGIDPKMCECDYTFGSDGKPHYVQGPHDTPAFRKNVIRTLTNRLGPSNFHWTLEAEGSEDVLDAL